MGREGRSGNEGEKERDWIVSISIWWRTQCLLRMSTNLCHVGMVRTWKSVHWICVVTSNGLHMQFHGDAEPGHLIVESSYIPVYDGMQIQRYVSKLGLTCLDITYTKSFDYILFGDFLMIVFLHTLFQAVRNISNTLAVKDKKLNTVREYRNLGCLQTLICSTPRFKIFNYLKIIQLYFLSYFQLNV